jgi:uncharacterized protein (TIGR00730 family)
VLDHRKNIPSLRAVTMPERATSQKARESWQLWGIISEFVEATERLSEIRPAVSIFGSARTPPGTPNYELTVEIARKLSDAGFAVISGGGPGIMEAANRGAYEGASPSVGLNIELPFEQSGNAYQDISLRFRHFFARKVAFVKYAAAYVVMPGGFGTLDELSEALTLIQTGKGKKMPVVLVGSAFWGGLLQWLRDTVAAEGMIGETDLGMMRVVDDSDAVVNALFDFYDARGFEQSATEREQLLYL